VKPVAGPTGIAIVTRLRITQADDAVLQALAGHLGRLRHVDLAAVSRPEPSDPDLDGQRRRQAYRAALNARKRDLTALSSARWAHAIIAANDGQCTASRAAQDRHIAELHAAITPSVTSIAQPTRRLSRVIGGGVWIPGGSPGLQNQRAACRVAGGFDSRPPPPPRPRRAGLGSRRRGGHCQGRLSGGHPVKTAVESSSLFTCQISSSVPKSSLARSRMNDWMKKATNSGPAATATSPES
jgi:hypothetical protein